MIKVTPDLGVIEINVHPSATYRETVKTTNAVYDEARLAACKFLKDGGTLALAVAITSSSGARRRPLVC